MSIHHHINLDSWNFFNCYLNRCACSTFHTILHHPFFLSTLLYFISVVKMIPARFKVKINCSHELLFPIKLSTLSFSLELPSVCKFHHDKWRWWGQKFFHFCEFVQHTEQLVSWEWRQRKRLKSHKFCRQKLALCHFILNFQDWGVQCDSSGGEGIKSHFHWDNNNKVSWSRWSVKRCNFWLSQHIQHDELIWWWTRWTNKAKIFPWNKFYYFYSRHEKNCISMQVGQLIIFSCFLLIVACMQLLNTSHYFCI